MLMTKSNTKRSIFKRKKAIEKACEKKRKWQSDKD